MGSPSSHSQCHIQWLEPFWPVYFSPGLLFPSTSFLNTQLLIIIIPLFTLISMLTKNHACIEGQGSNVGPVGPCTTLKPDPIIERLISQCYFTSRQGNRLLFFDSAFRKIGRHSFIDQAKLISELIPFEWSHLSPPAFKSKIKAISQPI